MQSAVAWLWFRPVSVHHAHVISVILPICRLLGSAGCVGDADLIELAPCLVGEREALTFLKRDGCSNCELRYCEKLSCGEALLSRYWVVMAVAGCEVLIRVGGRETRVLSKRDGCSNCERLCRDQLSCEGAFVSRG